MRLVGPRWLEWPLPFERNGPALPRPIGAAGGGNLTPRLLMGTRPSALPPSGSYFHAGLPDRSAADQAASRGASGTGLAAVPRGRINGSGGDGKPAPAKLVWAQRGALIPPWNLGKRPTPAILLGIPPARPPFWMKPPSRGRPRREALCH